MVDRIVIKGLGDITEDVVEVLQKRQMLNVFRATQQITAAAKAGGERRIIRDANGSAMGEVKMMIHPESFHFWGQKLGYDCWKDKQFVSEYLRDNEAARVKTRTERPTVLCGWEPNKRETTVYNKMAIAA